MNVLGLSAGIAAMSAIAHVATATAAPASVRPGEVIAVPIGPHAGVTRDNATVTIIEESGAAVTYEGTASIVRAVVALMADPVSRLAVDAARRAHDATHDVPRASGVDGDAAQVLVYVAVPVTLAPGRASIVVRTTDGRSFDTFPVDVAPSAAAPASEIDAAFAALERAEHRVVTMSAATIPHAAQVTFAYDADAAHPIVVNPHPAIANVVWSERGGVLRVLLTPASGYTPTSLADYTFYVAGAVSKLRLLDVTAYDAGGVRLSGVTVNVR